MNFRRCVLACLFFTATAWADDDDGPPGPDLPQVAQFQARAGMMTAAAISDDGKLVLTGEDDGLVTLWSVATGAYVHKYNGHARSVFAATLLPDGKRAVTCGDDNLVIVWELESGKRLREITTGNLTPLVMSCSGDGKLVAVGESDGNVVIWNLDTGKRIVSMQGHSAVYGVQFSPDGRTVAAGYADGQAVLWNAADGRAKVTIPAQDGASLGALAFSGDGRLLVTGNQNGVAAVWNTADGSRVSTLAEPVSATPTPPAFPVFPGGTITPGDYGTVAWVHVFGANAFTAGQNMAPKLWNMKTGRLVTAFPWPGDVRFYVARYGFPFGTTGVTPQGDFLAAVARDKDGNQNLVRVWKLPPPLAQ